MWGVETRRCGEVGTWVVRYFRFSRSCDDLRFRGGRLMEFTGFRYGRHAAREGFGGGLLVFAILGGIFRVLGLVWYKGSGISGFRLRRFRVCPVHRITDFCFQGLA